MKYLFCTDGSENSYSALALGLSFINAGSIVDIFYVGEEKNVLTKLYRRLFNIQVSNEKYNKKFEIIVKRATEIIEKHDQFLGKTFFEYGNVSNIINHANKNFYNMIIMGSRNYSGIINQLFSFSRKILDACVSSVFICRGDCILKDKKEKKHFLICIDETYQSLNAVISFMKNFNTENDVSLITVTQGFLQYSSESSLHDDGIQLCLEREISLADKQLDEIEKILCHNEIYIKSKIHLRGDPSEEILNFIKQDFDLLILGSHAKGKMIEVLFGSVSKYLLDYSFLPIVIIPTKSF